MKSKPTKFEEDVKQILLKHTKTNYTMQIADIVEAISTLCEEEVKRAINFDNLNYKIPRTFVLSDTKTGDLYQFDPTQQVIHSMGINMSKSYEGKLWLLNPAELKGKE